MIIETRVYASISKESLYKKGKEIGLEGQALEMFMYFNEIPLDITVEKENGMVIKTRAINQ